MIPTPEEAWELLCEYNQGEFHRKHGRIVGDVLRWYAIELGYEDEADFWEAVGILHDLDFEQWPEQHCIKEQELLKEKESTLKNQTEQQTADVDSIINRMENLLQVYNNSDPATKNLLLKQIIDKGYYYKEKGWKPNQFILTLTYKGI